VLLLESMDDDTVPNRTTEHLARAVGADLIRPVKMAIPGLREIRGPVTGNGPNGKSAGLCQFDWITVDGEVIKADHDHLPEAEEAHRVASHFLATCLGQGAGEILSAYPDAP
jgi:hypothetical protein